MDIEDSSVPYRAFLRSGSYPALTQRVMRSGGVLAQAAGWFAVVVTAASAGYTLTQRLVTPPSAASGVASYVRPAPKPAHASAPTMHDALQNEPDERAENESAREDRARPEQAAAPKRQDLAREAAAALVRTRAGGSAAAVAPAAAGALPEMEPERTDQHAERVRALDSVPPAVAAAPERVQETPESDPISDLLRASDERQRAALAREQRAAVPARPSVTPALPVTPSQPLVAAARVDRVAVRGPLSAAQLRRSVERVRPALSECYADAARRARRNRFSQVRVVVTIDEAGRVKTLPKVDGAQLPGLGACVGSAMSKLVCQAPDTGTATAAIVLGFTPES